ncbi:hypothetical protein FHU36_004385 [Nonomuraea muscovyensis]|uniref:Uncharacterized protein n=1 Tax=Nonomuraea muscovyensis TaxID=1124761 RepID=A0A7X0F0G9_9ACTN|nr:hypothetical protein [Nonomuraea muscovyensis]MBB6347840.1 hypothetical protein [Nonomuraea muscovyensis]
MMSIIVTTRPRCDGLKKMSMVVSMPRMVCHIMSRYSVSRTAAIRPGVAPTALSSPARRVRWTARPAASAATPVTARKLSSQLPRTRIGWAPLRMTASCSAANCQEWKLILTSEPRWAWRKDSVAAGSRSLRSMAVVTGRSWEEARERASERVIQARPL